MRFLRTASTGRLLALIGGLIVAIAAGTAIAVAATGRGSVPKAKPLAQTLHAALVAKPVTGITADISFTNNLISSDAIPGETADPLLQGARHGRVWLSNDGRLRIELQGDNGDANLVVNKSSFWVSDPMQNTVYEGTLPADTSGKAGKAGKPAPSPRAPRTASRRSPRSSRTSPRRSRASTSAGSPPLTPVTSPGAPRTRSRSRPSTPAGCSAAPSSPGMPSPASRCGSPSTPAATAPPCSALTATNITYGPVADSDLEHPAARPATRSSRSPAPRCTAPRPGPPRRPGPRRKHAQVRGVAAVAAHVPFAMAAPKALAGLPREGVSLLDWAGKPAALVTYGQGLGGIVVIEQGASSQAAAPSISGSGGGGLNLPTVSINGATGQELATPLGTVVRFTHGGVAYTVLGSVAPYAAETASRALTK